jgi:hypothetical protein
VEAWEVWFEMGTSKIGGMEKESQRVQSAEGEVELVAKDWRFKARSAVRGILGKGKEFWEDTEWMESSQEAIFCKIRGAALEERRFRRL